MVRRLLVFVLCCGLWSGAPGADVPRAAEDVRGLWVLRTSLTSPASIAEMVRLADAGGYNTLFVQVRGRGDAFYDSRVDPRALELRTQSPGFDPLQHTLTLAREAGLRVHAWFNVNLVASATTLPTDPTHIVRRHPEWLMVPQALRGTPAARDRRSTEWVTALARWTRRQADVEGLYLSPIHDGAQDYTLSVITDLLDRYSLDGLHLDYIRYPSADFEVDHPAQLRRDRLTTLVRRIRSEVAARPGLLLTAAVLPSPEDARDRKMQPWSEWAASGLLDAICPMAYAVDAAGYRQQVQDALAGAHGQPVWAGIGAWRLPVARTAGAIREARQQGAAGVLLFSYDSLVTAGARRGAYLSALRSAVAPDVP